MAGGRGLFPVREAGSGAGEADGRHHRYHREGPAARRLSEHLLHHQGARAPLAEPPRGP